ncbi:MAG: thrombospondin type 3 repeat-containing protein [bacterium]
MMRWLPILTVLLAACTSGADDPQFATFRQEIRGGQVNNTQTAVVGILAQLQGGTAICSGSLIAPNLVLTAQHCVAELDSQFVVCGNTPFGGKFAATSMYVTTQTQMSDDPSQYHRVSQILTPPGGNDTCGFDIALLVLSETIPSSEATPLVPRIDSAPEAGEVYTAVGYGHIGNGSGAGTRRSLDGRTVQCFGDACPFNEQAAGSEFVGSDGTCQGDSGGAPIDAEGRVLGALSRGPGQCDGSVYSSVFAWSDWVREQGTMAAEVGNYTAPAWVTLGVSETDTNDVDADGVDNALDNCPGVFNVDQADEDADGVGDACDEDADGDGVLDGSDNCPNVPNSDQQDRDSDGLGDLCDTDDDDDDVDDRFDNCPTISNPNQFDGNNDGVGDACAQTTVCDRYNADTGLFDGCGNPNGGTDKFVIGQQPRQVVGLGHVSCATGDPTVVGFIGLWLVGLVRRRR